MHKEELIAEYRRNVTNKYVTEVINIIDKKDNQPTKICRKCGVEMPLRYFYKHPLKKQGVTDVCKVCIRKQQKEYREKIKKLYLKGE